MPNHYMTLSKGIDSDSQHFENHRLMKKHKPRLACGMLFLLLIGMGITAQAQTQVPTTGSNIENVYIPPGSDDDQQILIIGELVCESSIGVTKTKKWMEPTSGWEGNATSTVASPQYGSQGEHIYERDLIFKQVNTPIAKVSSTNAKEPWAEDAFFKRIYFDDKGYYRVWSFNFDNQGDGANYSDQNDYFIETWRSFAKNTSDDVDTISGGYVTKVKSAPGFAYFAKQVNDGKNYSGVDLCQTTTFDLAPHHWEPIGYTFCGECTPEHRPFAGTYNGNGHFILNVVSLLPEKELGLFGYVTSTGTVKHTFTVGDQFYNTHDHAITNNSDTIKCPANLGALVGNTTGIIDGCEAANYLLHVHHIDNVGTIAAGGIAGNVGADEVGAGEVRNCFTSHISFHEDISGTSFEHCGGLVGNIASGGKVKNCYTKVNSETLPVNYAAIVGHNSNTSAENFTNCYTSATRGMIVGSGTAGTNIYAASDTVRKVDSTQVYVPNYTPTIGADHLGYMCIDNGVAKDSTTGLTLTEGKDYFNFKDANGSEVNLIPLFHLLNLNAKALNEKLDPNNKNYTPYAEWARPALAYYDGLATTAGSTGSIKRPINVDLPLLMLNNYVGTNTNTNTSPIIGQGGFRSVGSYGGIADILQYGGPDRDDNQLDSALIREKVNVVIPFGSIDGNANPKDCLFVYGDITSGPFPTFPITQAKVSIYEHAAICDAGVLANFNNTYVGITFDNSKKTTGIESTTSINAMNYGLELPRNWHMLSTPLTNAPLGFRYGGDNDPHNKPIDNHCNFSDSENNYDPAGFFNNPWLNKDAEDANGNIYGPNNPAASEFSWLGNDPLQGYPKNHIRYWMHGWGNSRDAGAAGTNLEYTAAESTLTYPASIWKDGYFPSKVNTSAIQFGGQLFISFNQGYHDGDGNGSNEYYMGNHRYPYGMDFYSWTEPDYHYINFKRNGPNHWHSDTPHVHLDYKPENASNNNDQFTDQFTENMNETHLLDGKGYMASIQIPTFLQTMGTLGGSTKTIDVTYTENYMDFCEGWNLVGNPFHAYLDFDVLCHSNPNVIKDKRYIVYNSNGYGSNQQDGNSGNYGNGFSYYVYNGSTGGAYANRYLHPHQGFFVRVDKNNTLTFKDMYTVPRSQIDTSGNYRDDSRPAYPLVNLFLASAKGCSDVCVVEFNRPEWGGATKMREMHTGNGLFYAAHDDDNYAALFATPDVERIPLKFEPKDKDGDTYTIHWNTQNGDFHKLILVDNITGVQYDMLRNSSYSFSGKKGDYWSRFYITFEVTGLDEEQDEDDDASTGSASTTFAFFDGSQWVVTNDGHGTATLDLIDLQGRVLHSTTLAEGQARIDLPDVAKGMYLMRMTNQKGVFVQKIVVR